MANEVKDVNPKEKMWLIRTATRILGPYNLEEIIQLLTINQIGFVDEIRRPKSRWNYIREYPYITEAVKNAKEKLNLDNTKTSPLTFANLTQLTRTELTKTELTKTELTPSDSIQANQTNNNIDINFEDIKDIEPLKETPFAFNPKAKNGNTANATGAKSFGLLQDQKVKSTIEGSKAEIKKKVIIAAALVVAILVVFKGIKFVVDQKKTKEKINSVARLYNFKLFSNANDVYQDLKSNNDIADDLAEIVNPLRLYFAKETNQVRTYALSAAEKSSSKKKAEFFNLAGLTYLYDSDFAKASENFQKALVIDPRSESAWINLIALKIKMHSNLIMTPQIKKEISDFYKNLSESKIENFENESLYLYLKGLLVFEFKDVLKDEISSVSKELYNVKSKSNFLRNEILTVYIGLKKAENTLTDEHFIELIESLPKQSASFARNPIFDWKLVEWSHLSEICEKIYNQSNQLMPKLFKTYCDIESSKYDSAEKLMNDSLLLAKGSNHYELMQLHLALAKGQSIQVESLLKKTDLANFPVTHYYQGLVCAAANNMECVNKEFSSLLDNSELSFLAQYHLYLADTQKNQKYVFEGNRKEKLFIPFLEIKEKLERVD